MSSAVGATVPSDPETRAPFWPRPAVNFEAAGLNPAQIEGLVLKLLLAAGVATGREIAAELGLSFGPFPEFLHHLQNKKLVAFTYATTAGDFSYTLTEAGRGAAMLQEYAYVGTAPVLFADYEAAVVAQTIKNEQPKKDDLRRAFSDLLISDEMFRTLGPAINSGQGMFLYGAPGNGKTSIAERITRCFGSTVWIPQVLDCEGQIVKLFDPAVHEAIERKAQPRSGLLRTDEPDGRWIEIRRPTIVAGGELTMDNLEIRYDQVTRICEASLQMKSNNGTLLIDDFGRQRMPPIEMLNRFIVPLEKRYDFQMLPNGKKIRVPFDQLILFSTNMEPKHLVDEAFLRRIPYKIHAVDPTETIFRRLFEIIAPKFGFGVVDPAALNHLIDRHYRAERRPFRYCHPRDLLLQVRNYCIYNDRPMVLTPESLDVAVANYFTVMDKDEPPADPAG